MNDLIAICGLIISYNPTENIIHNVDKLLKQVQKVIVVDNGSFDSASRSYLETLQSLERLEIIFNNENLGIATGLNQGINIAIQEKYEWIITFDQDTVIPQNFTNDLLKCHDSIDSNIHIAIMCAVYINTFSSYENKSRSDHYKCVRSTMTSGSLMKISAIKEIGMFDENLFIDWVDHDYCMRARIAKYKIIESTHTSLIHSPGRIKQHLFFGSKIYTSNHSPTRRYYMYRNRIIALRRYFVFDPTFILQDWLIGLKEFVKIALFEEEKIAKIEMVCRGVRDGIFTKKDIHTGNSLDTSGM
jgi:rhamnosyltransferase